MFVCESTSDSLLSAPPSPAAACSLADCSWHLTHPPSRARGEGRLPRLIWRPLVSICSTGSPAEPGPRQRKCPCPLLSLCPSALWGLHSVVEEESGVYGSVLHLPPWPGFGFTKLMELFVGF